MTSLLKSKPLPVQTFQVQRIRNGQVLASTLLRGTSARQVLQDFILTALGQPESIEDLPDGHGGTYSFAPFGPEAFSFRCEIVKEK